ncbi:peptidase E [Flavobacteriaceae bacterium]|nr:peptidase E [Flavobacteriaceae bacterium]
MPILYALLFTIISLAIPIKMEHKFYVSTTSIEYKKVSGTLQITSQFFIDDIESLLRKYEADLKLAPDFDSKRIDQLFEIELKKHFRIKIAQKWVDHTFLGKEYKNEILVCYLEVKTPQTPQSLVLQNRMLFDLFEEQQHIIHFKNEENRKSILLHAAEDTKTISFN